MNRTCRQCAAAFEIAERDLDFYRKASPTFVGEEFPLPPPFLCPECRRQRRLAWRNERVLYTRPCNLCGTGAISVFSPEAPCPVYCNRCWWSDRWDPLDFGIEWKPGVSFFDQYRTLYARVPQRAMVNDDGVSSINCAYTFDVAFSKNCYLCVGIVGRVLPHLPFALRLQRDERAGVLSPLSQ